MDLTQLEQAARIVVMMSGCLALILMVCFLIWLFLPSGVESMFGRPKK